MEKCPFYTSTVVVPWFPPNLHLHMSSEQERYLYKLNQLYHICGREVLVPKPFSFKTLITIDPEILFFASVALLRLNQIVESAFPADTIPVFRETVKKVTHTILDCLFRMCLVIHQGVDVNYVVPLNLVCMWCEIQKLGLLSDVGFTFCTNIKVIEDIIKNFMKWKRLWMTALNRPKENMEFERYYSGSEVSEAPF